MGLARKLPHRRATGRAGQADRVAVFGPHQEFPDAWRVDGIHSEALIRCGPSGGLGIVHS